MRRQHRITLCTTVTGLLVAAAAVSAPAQEVFATIRGSGVDIRYMRGVAEAEARQAADYIQAEYDSVTRQLRLTPKKRIEVRIYDSVSRYLSESGLKKPWRGAYYVRGIIHCQPVQALLQREIFDQTLTSEVSRAVLQTAADNGCPLWLRESYAAFRVGAFRKMSAPVGAKLTAFSDLNQDIQSYPDPPQRDDVQYMLGQTMEYFVRTFGPDKAMALFAEFDGTRGVETVVRRVFGEEYISVERSWAAYIASKTAPFRR